MKDMRQLINLMEGCSMIPGLGERRDLNFEQVQPGGQGGEEAQMQTAGTVGRGAAYSAFDAAQTPATESAPPGEEKLVKSLKKEYPGHEDKAFATAWSIYNKKHGKKEEGVEESVPAVASCNQDNPASCRDACAMEESVTDHNYTQCAARFGDLLSSYVEPQEAFDVIQSEMDQMGFDAEEQDHIMARLEQEYFPDHSEMGRMDDAHADAEAGAGIHDVPFEESFNLQNGYDDVKFASGKDYFPDGADSPVVDATGPSGARMGDNPEQKKMEVTETHKELVYSYRNFLKESARK